MALAADKAKAKAIVATASFDVPRPELLRADMVQSIARPAVVKANTSDNSDGVSLVRTSHDYASALHTAFKYGNAVLVEECVELGREVRWGVVERCGEIVCLPLEEYFGRSANTPGPQIDRQTHTHGGQR